MSAYEQMFTDWVKNEAREMGYDFNGLSREKQNELFVLLMTGLENGYRSRMDSPDLRFARRKGIHKHFSSHNENAGIEENENNDLRYTTDEECINAEQCSNTYYCTHSSGQCINTNCTNSGPHAHCSDQSATCIDTSCFNNGADCGDIIGETGVKCVDSSCANQFGCSNIGQTGNNCVDDACVDNNQDIGCSDARCEDVTCINSSKGPTGGDPGCADSAYCINNSCINWDKNGCGNNETDERCTNQPFCSDIESCTDNNVYCKDLANPPCSDASCGNGTLGSGAKEVCLDQSGCIDESCNNSTNCIDASTSQYCKDNTCSNSSKPGGGLANCADAFQCFDNGCKNEEFCYDNNNCRDSGCVNSKRCFDANLTCVDIGCQNTGKCDIGGLDPLEPIAE